MVATVIFLAACKPEAKVPEVAQSIKEEILIYPDYRDVTIPPNIAPLNFLTENAGDQFVVEIKGQGEPLLAAAGKDGKLQFNAEEWKKLLQTNKGRQLTVTLYAHRDAGWVSLPTWHIDVASEPISATC